MNQKNNLTIKLRTGKKAEIPVLAIGEPAYAADTNQLYIGTPVGNVLVNTGGGGGDITDYLRVDTWDPETGIMVVEIVNS